MKKCDIPQLGIEIILFFHISFRSILNIFLNEFEYENISQST